MMPARCVRAVLAVADLALMTGFYQAVLGARVLHSDADHAALALEGFKLFLQRLPAAGVNQNSTAGTDKHGEPGSVRLWFSVESLAQTRAAALAHGGHVDPAPPPWVVDQQSICQGHDPEGNGFQLIEEPPPGGA